MPSVIRISYVILVSSEDESNHAGNFTVLGTVNKATLLPTVKITSMVPVAGGVILIEVTSPHI